jgi:hypothetical protein
MIAADENEDSAATERRKRFGWMSISVAAFMMSATATGLNIYYALKGSEITVQKPRHVLLYRDGEGENAVLSVAMRLEAINTASDYGDVILDTRLSISDGSAQFAHEGQASPAFTANAEEAAAKCGIGQSCIGTNGLVVVQRSDQIMDLSGGAAKAFTPYFWLIKNSCDQAAADCARWDDFDSASEILASDAPEFRVHINFQKDGDRTIICTTPQVDREYLTEFGWTQLPCLEAQVDGEPWL